MMVREPDQALYYGIFQKKPPEHAFPGKRQRIRKKQWKPWHKPRKQLIRSQQWYTQIGQLIDELGLVDRPLRYLSLPGEDLLDIRVIRRLCEGKKVQLHCLGFDDGTYSPDTETEINISKNEVFQSSIIFPGSDVKKDDFARISDENSQAYKEAKYHGPYDIINLDLCGSFSRTQGLSYYNALKKIIDEIQIKGRSQPWLFFLTTRADIVEVNTDDLPLYWINLKNNVQRCDTFKNKLDHLLGNRFDHINANVQELQNLEQATFGRFFALCIAKWLLQLMLSGSPLWKTEMLDSYWYRVSSAKAPNMLSLSFLFRQVTDTRQDPTGLAEAPDTSNEEFDESALAISALTKTESLIDIDKLLRDDRTLFNEMVNESEKLLGSARYPIKEYSVWAKKQQKSLIKRLRN